MFSLIASTVIFILRAFITAANTIRTKAKKRYFLLILDRLIQVFWLVVIKIIIMVVMMPIIIEITNPLRNLFLSKINSFK